jgi:hypothetical protein
VPTLPPERHILKILVSAVRFRPGPPSYSQGVRKEKKPAIFLLAEHLAHFLPAFGLPGNAQSLTPPQDLPVSGASNTDDRWRHFEDETSHSAVSALRYERSKNVLIQLPLENHTRRTASVMALASPQHPTGHACSPPASQHPQTLPASPCPPSHSWQASIIGAPANRRGDYPSKAIRPFGTPPPA